MASLWNTLSKAFGQLGDMSLPQRVAIVLGAVLVGGSLLWMAQWAASPEMVPLLNQTLSAEDVTLVRSGLDSIGEPYQLAGSQVLVRGSADRSQIIAKLQQSQKLPADTSIGFKHLVEEANPWISQEENQRRWTVALKTELERVLREFAGVRRAHVFLDINARPRGFTRSKPTTSASVTLIMDGGEPVARSLALAAARMIAGSVRGLSLRDVEVLDGSGRAALDWESEQGDSTSALQRLERQRERETARKLMSQLSFDPKLRVSVQVLLDHTARQMQDSKPYDPVTIQSTRSSTRTNRTRNSGQAGVQPNVGQEIGGGGQDETSETETEDTRSQAGVTVTQETTAAGEVRQIFAAINVSHSYLASVFKRNNPEADEPTEAQIQEVFDRQKPRIVSQAAKLVLPPDEEQVAVEWYYDVLDEDVAVEPTAVAISTDMAMKFGAPTALGMLAVFSVFMLMRMARSGSAEAFGLEVGLPKEAIEAAKRAAEDIEAAPTASGESDAKAAGVIPAAMIGLDGAVLEGRELDEESIEINGMIEQVAGMIEQETETAASMIEGWMDRGR